MDRHDQIQPLLGDYVLGELSPAEMRNVHSHVQVCSSCAAEARELGLAFQSIGLAEEPVTPPPALRARVLADLAQQGPSRARPGAQSAHKWKGSIHPAWLAAAAAVILILGGWLALALQRTADLRDDLRSADAEIARLQDDMSMTVAQADLAVSILTARDMRRIDLAGLGASRETTARAYWSLSRGLLIVADELPTPPTGRVYQVWLSDSDSAAPVSAGFIEAPRSGRGMLIVPAVDGIDGSTVTVAVTDEPAGGVPAPTGAKHLTGSI